VKILDAVVSPQKIIQISGQSRITLLKKYPNSLKWSKFTMRIMFVCCGLSITFFYICRKCNWETTTNNIIRIELWPFYRIWILIIQLSYSRLTTYPDDFWGLWFFEYDLYWWLTNRLLKKSKLNYFFFFTLDFKPNSWFWVFS
jgi:hypothetical protein